MCNECRLNWSASQSTYQLQLFCKGHSEWCLTVCDWGSLILHTHNNESAAHESAVRYCCNITQSRGSLHWRCHSEIDVEPSSSTDWAFSLLCFLISFWRCWSSWAHLSMMTQISSYHTELKDWQTCLSEMSLHCCSQLWVWVFRCWWSIYVMSAFSQGTTESMTLQRMFRCELWASHASDHSRRTLLQWDWC